MPSFLSRLSREPKSDLFGGLTAAVTALPLAIAFGVMVTNELGPEWSSVGAVAGLYGAIFTGFFAALFGGTPCQVTGPTGPMTTVMAGLVGTLAATYGGQLQGQQILLAAFFCVTLAGILQIVMGLLRLGGLVNYIPYPVVAGFMNGIAVIIFLGQRRPFLGSEDGTWDVATTLVGVLTVAIIMLSPKVTRAVPGSLVGLLLGTALYYAAKGAGAVVGPVVGEVPTALPSMKNLFDFFTIPSFPVFREILPVLLVSAVSLAILGAIDSLLTSVVADTVTKTRHDSNRELIGQGIGNAAAGVFGGFAGAGATIRTLVNINAGGRDRFSGMAHSLVLLLVVVAVGSTAGKIPNVVLSAILMVTAWGMLDRWSGGLIKKLASASQSRQEIAVNLGLVLLVTVVTVAIDLMVAVAVGLVLASLHFVLKTGATVVRGTYTGEELFSRRVYPVAAQQALDGRGRETLILELQGALFFGSADKFLRAAEQSLTPTTQRMILDLHRVTGIDSSGGLAIAQLQDTLTQSGRKLAIAGLDLGSAQGIFLHDLGIVEAVQPEYFFQDLDRALEWSEVVVLDSLQRLEGSYAEIELRSVGLFQDWAAPDFEAVTAYLEPLEKHPGEYLFHKGDRPDSVVIVTAGAVHLFVGDKPDHGGRLAHFGPGSTIGEVTLFVGEPKSSHAVVDLPLKGYELTRTALERMQAERPDLSSRLLWAFGRELSQRIRVLRHEVHTLEL